MHAHIRDNLDLLSSQLFRAQTAYERARSRGDAERVDHARLQLSAIIAERDRLMKAAPEPISPSVCH
jgi:hypothetical protein